MPTEKERMQYKLMRRFEKAVRVSKSMRKRVNDRFVLETKSSSGKPTTQKFIRIKRG